MIISSDIKKKLPVKELNNIYFVADFDRTITNGNSKTSWSILANSKYVPESYVLERQKLYDHYRPIEISENIEYTYKTEQIKKWYIKHIELFIKYKLSNKIFEEAANNLRIMEFRPYAKEFLEFLHEKQIPLIIISAGIGNFIESFLINNNCYFDNIYVSSNKIVFKDGIAVGVEENIIHSFNKNEVSLPIDIRKKIENKKNVILLGDQISDLNMVNKKNHDQVISIGFLTKDVPKNIMEKNFDIVCEENDTYEDVRKILFLL